MKRIMAIFLAVILLSFTACTGTPAPTEPPLYDGLGLDTPVGRLEISQQWLGSVRVEQSLEDGLYVAHVYGTTGQHEALLFAVYVGEQGHGHLFGTAPDGQGNRQAIRVDIESFEGDDTWDQQELELVWRMQQHVNDLIDQIYELPGFAE